MFLGQYERTLDSKGRLAVPLELRSGLSSGAVLARGFDQCLHMYAVDKWEVLARSVEELPVEKSSERAVKRSFFAGAAVGELDGHGRLVIPAFLREHAGLVNDAVVIGAFSHVEIWDPHVWLREQKRYDAETFERVQGIVVGYQA